MNLGYYLHKGKWMHKDKLKEAGLVINIVTGKWVPKGSIPYRPLCLEELEMKYIKEALKALNMTLDDLKFEKKFVEDGLKKARLNDFLASKLERAGYGGMVINRTPQCTQITIFAEKPGMVIGKSGKTIKKLTSDVKQFKLDNPQIEVKEVEKPEDTPNIKVEFDKGDVVKIRDGAFENFEGVVDEIDSERGIVCVIVTIFGRSTPLDIEYWQIEKV